MQDTIDPRWVSLVVEPSGDHLLLSAYISEFGSFRQNDPYRAEYTFVGSVDISPCLGKVTSKAGLLHQKIGWAPRTAAPEYMGFVEFSDTFPIRAKAPAQGEPTDIELYVDRCSIELFAIVAFRSAQGQFSTGSDGFAGECVEFTGIR